MRLPIRTIADALVITAVAALSMAFAASTDWPRWAHIITLIPAAYLVSRLSGDRDLPWWKPVGFLGYMILMGFLSSGTPEERIIPTGYTLPIFFLTYLAYTILKMRPAKF